MLYTLIIGSSGIEVVVLVLDIIGHKKYDKKKKFYGDLYGKLLPEDCSFMEV
jgi:hypothetical protein